MKDRTKQILKLLLILFITGGVCYLIFFQVDYIMNGSFVDWFESQFTYTQSAYSDEFGGEYVQKVIDWYSLKAFLMIFFTVFVFALVLAVTAILHFYGKRKTRKNVEDLNEKIHRYMTKDLDMDEVFPAPYTEVGAQMLQLKSGMIQKEETLKREAQRKNDLITYLAHDLKTPLTSVLGYLHLLDEAPDMPTAQKAKYTHIALEKAERLEDLIEEFFEITQYNFQNIYLEKENLDLSYMLMQMTEEFYPILSAHGNEIKLETEENLHIDADPDRMARVFNNILKNAVAYSYPDTPIKVQAFQKKERVLISFENQGKNIPKEKLDMIFEKFFRLDSSRRSNTGGAGLGLAIAKEIVELHGGSISAKSENERVIFTVELPVN
ncbi:sensor histidine kinase [Blautia sp. An81]|uniref:sensor histidine kinase n=1 Tax=Blautia sp. An81 TaxID=1965659 RepID=UPI001FA8C527|nr:HAMP domain-containing sensor histidine kinase [Blautia sp. An81]